MAAATRIFRNVVLSNALLQFAKMHGKTVTQKILEKGHTQMEVDSVHATIGTRLKPPGRKPKSIYSPAMYVDVMRDARKDPGPYSVEYVDHTFFSDYTSISALKSIRPGLRVGDPTVADLRAIKYTADGSLLYKWEQLPTPRKARADSDCDIIFMHQCHIYISRVLL